MSVWLDPESFRRAYVAYARRQQNDPNRVVRLGEALVGLDDLYEHYLASDPDDLEALFADRRRRDAWEAVAPRLRPQFTTAQPEDALLQPWGELALGVTLDGEWVRPGQALAWGREPEVLFEEALARLDEITEELPFSFARDRGDRFVAFETGDGFDAVRLLLPRLRRRIVCRLGETFQAAIPNRDYLICWASDASKEFQEFVRNRVREDHATHARPLAAASFRVTADGVDLSRMQLLAG